MFSTSFATRSGPATVGRPTRYWAIGLVCCLSVAGATLPAMAQVGDRTVPGDMYFLSFRPYYAGEYKAAARAFRDAAAGGIQDLGVRWVDSICYHTMIGECHYRMGELPQALDRYEAALNLYLMHNDWLLRIDFPRNLSASGRTVRSTIRWGASKRPSVLGHFPDSMLSAQGRLDNETVLRQGGVVQAPRFIPVDVKEVVRCTVLAMRRRRDLLGPACPHSPFTNRLLAAAATRPGPANHWSRAWVDVQLGVAYAAAGKTPQAIAELRRSLLIAGQYDHPMTGVALLELGKLAFEQGQYEAAATYFLEATLIAARLGQADVVEEAFVGGLQTHFATNRPNLYPPLLQAASWAKLQRFGHLQATLLALASENHSVVGDVARAGSLLDDARRTVAARDMKAGDVGARIAYQAALIQFQKGNVPAGDAALAEAMTFQRKGSHRLFQIQLVDRLYVKETITARIAADLFALVLREPTAADWAVDPRETLATVLVPHPLPMEHWFDVAIERKEPEKAMEIADRIRRHRFFSNLPMGGRLLALRWVLEAPKDRLDERSLLQRQSLLAQYPVYAALSEKSATVRGQLRQLPMAPDDPRVRVQQNRLFEELEKIATQQEAKLREIAVRREPSEFVFPPLKSTKEIQAGMSDGEVAMVFFATSRYVYTFMLSKDKYAHWQVPSPDATVKATTETLRAMGHHDKNQVLAAPVLADDAWKQPSTEVMRSLVNRASFGFWDHFDELIIVPDGMLWFVPFEALHVPEGDSSVPLLSKVRIRYVPTASLIPADRGRIGLDAKTAVVAGRLYPRDAEEVSVEAADDIARVLPQSVTLSTPSPSPSHLANLLWDRLIVLADVDEKPKEAFDWSPSQLDGTRPSGKLASWFELPWGAPAQVVLPGFHTDAESGLKNKDSGQEVFLAVCGLMANGTRTILLSRWRTGGQTGFDLIREFAQELPHATPANAWQRSVQLAVETEIDPEREPRVKTPASGGSVKARHPFFWGGYLLIDTGTSPGADEEPVEPEERPNA